MYDRLTDDRRAAGPAEETVHVHAQPYARTALAALILVILPACTASAPIRASAAPISLTAHPARPAPARPFFLGGYAGYNYALARTPWSRRRAWLSRRHGMRCIGTAGEPAERRRRVSPARPIALE